MHRVVILAIGNELLIGETLDTNTNWLCHHFTALGFQVTACLILPDKINVISEIISKLLRGDLTSMLADLIVTTGGLGPTDDDLTLAAIAQALELPLKTNEIAYQWIKEKYQQLAKESFIDNADMNPARDKMAMLPMNAIPIENPIGVAPAIKLTYKTTTIISLPGVPKEMKGLMLGPIEPILSNLFGVGAYLEEELWALCGDESILAPILRQVCLAHPDVYIKSKAKGFGANLRFQIKLHVNGEANGLKTLLSHAISDLEKTLNQYGIKVEY